MSSVFIAKKDSISNSWKEREKLEVARYQNHLIHMKRNNLAMRKQLHNSLRFFLSERGAWNEGPKEIKWMLSSHKNREGMPCKLVENLQYDNRYYMEASRLRDYSTYSVYLNADTSKSMEATDTEATGAEQRCVIASFFKFIIAKYITGAANGWCKLVATKGKLVLLRHLPAFIPIM